MQEVIKKEKVSFDFIDSIRCVAMIGIVFEHCTVLGEPKTSDFYLGMLHVSVMQFFKFATIVFFLIAGFLINHKFTEYTPGQYLKNRFKNTIKPWLFWLHVLLLCNIGSLLFRAFKFRESQILPDNFFHYLGEQYYHIIVSTSFWFILNFLICISILLLFKRYIYKLWFGLNLCCVSLFYGLNLYHGWIITNHTTALFGFVFYLWIGAYANRYHKELFAFINKVPMWCFIIITAFFFVLADLETLYLKSLAINDIYNTLRVSNILYSLSFFLILLKIGSIGFINKYFKPRSSTFGIYLIHHIVILHIITELFRPLKIDINHLTLSQATGYTILRFVITYSITMLIVMLIRRTKLKWSIGAA